MRVLFFLLGEKGTSMEQFIKIDGAQDAVYIQLQLSVQITEAEEGGYVSYCPALDIVSQGETFAEAKANIKEAVGLLVETCFERGTLAKRLAKSGFQMVGKKRTSRKTRRKPLSSGVREIRVPAKIPLMAYC